jgi:hypothetical protein
MKFAINWPMLVGAVFAYYGTLTFYRLFLHPLARFPGPRLAAVSRWYEGYYDVVLGGQYTPKIAKLHKIYGRLFPNGFVYIESAFDLTLNRTHYPHQPV